ncbi:MAG: F0F1 ATP synthase subunit epsilon [Clostridia bacterium]|nr:F0F1 ATP synthase subunit epsilon [Clostridia bacterium]
MNTFKLKISTPDGDMYSGEAVKLDVRGIEGELAVMAGHIPFMTALVPCDCRVLLPDGNERVGTLENGLLSVGSSEVTLLASGYKWK